MWVHTKIRFLFHPLQALDDAGEGASGQPTVSVSVGGGGAGSTEVPPLTCQWNERDFAEMGTSHPFTVMLPFELPILHHDCKMSAFPCFRDQTSFLSKPWGRAKCCGCLPKAGTTPGVASALGRSWERHRRCCLEGCHCQAQTMATPPPPAFGAAVCTTHCPAYSKARPHGGLESASLPFCLPMTLPPEGGGVTWSQTRHSFIIHVWGIF